MSRKQPTPCPTDQLRPEPPPVPPRRSYSLPAKKLDQIQRDRLRRLLQDRTVPELIRQLFSVVPHPRAFLVDEICEFASPVEIQKMIASYEAQDACEREGAR